MVLIVKEAAPFVAEVVEEGTPAKSPPREDVEELDEPNALELELLKLDEEFDKTGC